MNVFGRWLITCFGLGYLRPAPGTWGSLPPVLVSLVLVMWLGNRGPQHETSDSIIVNALLVVVCAAFSLVCIGFGAQAEELCGCKDPASVVADEVAGQCIALLFLPWQWSSDAHGIQRNAPLAAAAFLAFRAMDIIKPPPARNLQRLQGGVGILVDDLVAGLYALVIVQLIARFLIPAWF